jgi:hypothetical protein
LARRTRARSASTISRITSSRLAVGDQPSLARALLDLRRPIEFRVDLQVIVHLQPGVAEGDLAHLAYGHGAAGGDDVVVGLVLLQHQPHGADVVAGVAPVALDVDVAEPQLADQPAFDPSHRIGDLAGDELDAAQRALVVEQDARRGVQPKALAVVHRRPVPEQLGDGVGRARVERRGLGLRRGDHPAEHLRR